MPAEQPCILQKTKFKGIASHNTNLLMFLSEVLKILDCLFIGFKFQ